MSMPSVPKSGTISALLGNVFIETTEVGTIGIKITGTFGATLTFEATVDGANWDNVPVYTINSAPALVLNTVNTAGLWRASVAGYAHSSA
jgi:hypothetical protein